MILAILISLPLFFSTPICPTEIVPCVSPDPPRVVSVIYLPVVIGP